MSLGTSRLPVDAFVEKPVKPAEMLARIEEVLGQEQRSNARRKPALVDTQLLFVVVTLLALGIVMVGSASIGIADRQTGDPFHYLFRQGGYVVFGVVMAVIAYQVPLSFWERIGPLLLVASLLMLAVLLIPGVGRNVNGATRWLNLVIFNLQVSEVAKLSVVIYLAGYLVRHSAAVLTTVGGFIKPMGVMALVVLLLLLEPDFGASVVVIATAMGMLSLGGVQLWLFGVLLVVALLLLAVYWRSARPIAWSVSPPFSIRGPIRSRGSGHGCHGRSAPHEHVLPGQAGGAGLCGCVCVCTRTGQ